MTVDRPELIKILNKDESDWTPEMAFVYHILYTFAHVYHMWQRNVIKGNEWAGWLRWIIVLEKWSGTGEVVWSNIRGVYQ